MKRTTNSGMTLVEILIVVTIIALLSAFIIPAVTAAINSRKNAEAASNLRTLVAVFELFASENGNYPSDVNRGVAPPEMTSYFNSMNITWFAEDTALGGKWDWGNGQMGFSATMSIAGPTVSQSQMEEFDRRVDDGNLSAGIFRQDGDHYFYIIKR
jgi:prepilin-type N-terminal cleavage/methylation domain-containing protein